MSDQLPETPPPESDLTDTPPTPHRKKNLFFLVPIAMIVVIGAGFLIVRQSAPSAVDQTGGSETPTASLPTTPSSDQSPILPTPTPFPFSEMTIPTLRERIYESTLGERSVVSQNALYTSYQVPYDSDGLLVNGLLTIPNSEPPPQGFPAVVFIHGYIPPTTYNTLSNYTAYVDFLARQEIVVYKIDLRGHGTSEGEAHGGYFSEGYVIDALNAYAALSTIPEVNSENIGLWGHSMAGNIVARAVASYQTIPKAVIWAGAVYTYADMQAYGISDMSYRPPPGESDRQRRRDELFNTHGRFSEDSEFWTQVVPVNYLDGVETEFQIHHAVDDTVVSIEYSRNLSRILGENTIAHEVFEYPSGGHNISGGSFTTAMQRTADFYKK